MNFTTIIEQKFQDRTTTDPSLFKIECYGEGTEEECKYIAKLLKPQKTKKIKVYIKEKISYRSKPLVNMPNDMVKLDLRMSKKEFYKLLSLLEEKENEKNCIT
jgi:hypothetical protein